MGVLLRSILQCPHCGFKVTESMSISRCVLVYACPACHAELAPQAGRCVFCSHGSVGCPDSQQTGQCCIVAEKPAP